MDFLKCIADNIVLADNQFGFRPSYSTKTVLFTIIENIRKNLDLNFAIGL